MSQANAAVNVNTADANTLTQFNGVGPSTAQKIIDYRTANGDFASCDDLTKVKGIGPATLEKIKPIVLLPMVKSPLLVRLQALCHQVVVSVLLT